MRHSFLYPIPQIEIAISYLDEAVDFYLSEKFELASEKLVQADMKEIAAYYKLIVGKTKFPIHWQHRQPKSIEKKKEFKRECLPLMLLEIFLKEMVGDVGFVAQGFFQRNLER